MMRILPEDQWLTMYQQVKEIAFKEKRNVKKSDFIKVLKINNVQTMSNASVGIKPKIDVKSIINIFSYILSSDDIIEIKNAVMQIYKKLNVGCDDNNNVKTPGNNIDATAPAVKEISNQVSNGTVINIPTKKSNRKHGVKKGHSMINLELFNV
jgi:hypothetical protein